MRIKTDSDDTFAENRKGISDRIAVCGSPAFSEQIRVYAKERENQKDCLQKN